MAIICKRGWVSLYFSISLLLIISFIFVTFSFNLKLYHEMKTDKICRENQNRLFNATKNMTEKIFSLNSLAISLNTMQNILLPFIWHPSVAEIYTQLLKIRENFEKVQNVIIKTANIHLSSKKLLIYKDLIDVNKEIKKKFMKNYDYNFIILPPFINDLAIQKKFNYIFPPYEKKNDFKNEQRFKILTKVFAKSKNTILFSDFSSWKICSATLEEKNGELKIIYDKKNILSSNSW